MIIKNRKAGETTIQNKLNEYLGLLVVLFLLITVTATGFCLTVTLEMTDHNDQIYELSRFFDQLKDEQSLAFDVLLRTATDQEEELQSGLVELKDLQEDLASRSVSAEYQRGIEDIGILLEGYEALILGGEKMAGSDRYGELVGYADAVSGYSQVLNEEVLKKNRTFLEHMFQRILLYIGALVTTMVLILIYILGKNFEILKGIVRPLQSLTGRFCRMNFLEENIPEAMAENQTYHREINQMIRGYNQMVEKNQTLLAEHYELLNTRLKLQKQELAKLQHQINPHFLFNTLNMISQTAYLENDKKVVGLLETTANLLRYSLDYSSREVTLRQEMSAAENYLTIQEERFGDRISFETDMDECAGDLKMPSLLVQPLIENAIIHGLGACEEGGMVRVCASADLPQKQVRISVADNGQGMEPQQVQAVLDKMNSRKDDSSHIGLVNVYVRLKICFGEAADIQIRSKKGEGTEVVLLMPCDKNTL